MLSASSSLRVSGTEALRQMDLSSSLGSATCRLFDLGQHTFSFWASVSPSVKSCAPCLLRQLWGFDGSLPDRGSHPTSSSSPLATL